MANKKYCEYPKCYMQLHQHTHTSEHTVTFAREELRQQRPILSIQPNLFDGAYYLNLSNKHGIFQCEVIPQTSPFNCVEISPDDIEQLRMFLNEMHNIETENDT